MLKLKFSTINLSNGVTSMTNKIDIGQITLECPECGNTEFFRIDHNVIESTITTCASCGFATTFGELKTMNNDKAKKLANDPETLNKVKKEAERMIKNALKKR